MGEGLCILLYGGSVLLAGIKIKLGEWPGLRLISVAAGTEKLLELVDSHGASALLFDLTTVPHDFVLPLLGQRSRLVLVGLDPSSDELLVLTCQTLPKVSVTDIVTVIQRNLAILQGPFCNVATNLFSP